MNTWGSAEHPPCVFVHGFMQSNATWDVVARTLSRRWFVLAPELASVTVSDATLDDLLRCIDKAVQTGIEESGRPTATLVGYSMGGRLALEYAKRHPEKLNGLMLESSGFGPESAEQRAEYAARDAEWAGRLRTAPFSEFLEYWETLPVFFSQQNLPSDLRESLYQARRAQSPEVLAIWLDIAGAHVMEDEAVNMDALRTLHAERDIPILYLCGSRDTKYHNLGQRIRRADCATVEELPCGHNVHLENPEAYCDAVDNFLKTAAHAR